MVLPVSERCYLCSAILSTAHRDKDFGDPEGPLPEISARLHQPPIGLWYLSKMPEPPRPDSASPSLHQTLHKRRVSERKHRVYRDRSCILALEEFLVRAAQRETAA